MSMPVATRGGVLVPALLLVAVAGIASAAFVGTRPSDANERPGTAARTKLNDPEAADLLLRRLHITPDALAAAGVTPQQADGLLTAMPTLAPANDRMSLINQATIALSQARERAVRAPRQADAGLPTVVQAQAALDGLLNDAFNAVVASLPVDRAEALRTIRANRERFNMPAYYLAANRSDAQWLALRTALAAQRIAARDGTPLNPRAQQTISEADGEPAVATARTAHLAHAASIDTLWRSRLARVER